MNEQALRFRVGVFVLSSLILLAVLVTLFGGFPSVFKHHDTFFIVVHDASGVGPGTPVRKAGVRIGEVQAVALEPKTGEVKITIVVDRPNVIHTTDRAELVHSLLGGDTTIDIVPQPAQKKAEKKTPPSTTASPPKKVEPTDGAEESEPEDEGPAVLPPGATIPAAPQGDARRLINDVNRLMPTIETTLKHFDRLAPELDRTIRQFRSLAREAQRTVPEIRRTNDELFVATRYWSRVGERLDVLLQTNQDKMVKALDNFNDTLIRVGNLFSDENQRLVNQTLKNLSRGTANLDMLTRSTDDFLKEGSTTLKQINASVKQTDEVLNNIQRATKPMADRSAAIMHNLDESTMQLNRLIQESRQLLQVFQGSNGTLAALLNDPTLYNNLVEITCMAKRAMPELDQALKSLEVFADKLARHPESIGLGGVVRPGSGLNR